MQPRKPGENISPIQPKELGVGPEIKSLIKRATIRNRILVGIPVLFFLGAIISGIFDSGTACLLGVGCFISTVAMLAYLFVGSTKFKYKYRQTIVNSFLKNAFNQVEYEPDSFLDLRVFYDSGLSHIAPNRYEANNYIKIERPQYVLETTYMFATKVRRTNAEGTSSSSELAHMGMYFRYHMKVHFPTQIIILSDTSGSSWANLNNGPDYIFSVFQKIPMDNRAFEKEFELYTKHDEKAVKFLDADMQQFLLELKERLNTDIEISFMDDCMHLTTYMEREIFQPGLVLFSNGSPVKRTAKEVKWLKDTVEFIDPTIIELVRKYGY